MNITEILLSLSLRQEKITLARGMGMVQRTSKAVGLSLCAVPRSDSHSGPSALRGQRCTDIILIILVPSSGGA